MAPLATPPGWRRDGEAFERVYVCADFDDAIAFVDAIASTANRLDHHPEIAIAWNRVTVRTWSHDAGTVTERDAALAAAIDALR